MENNMELTISIVSIIIASLFDTIKDLSEEGNLKFKNESYWLKYLSYVRKWKTEGVVLIVNNKRLWYYLWFYKPQYKERFPYSSTVLVFLTDGWHLMKYLYLIFNFICICSLTIYLLPLGTYEKIFGAIGYFFFMGALHEYWRNKLKIK